MKLSKTAAILLLLFYQGYSARSQRIFNYMPRVINSGIGYNSIFFSKDCLHGWIAGSQGHILRTDNGGQNWKEADSVLSSDGRPIGHLNRIFFATDSLGWAAGDNGTILYSRNGGRFWTSAVRVPGHQNVNSVFFTPKLNFGIAACDNAVIWISQDSGKTWAANNRIPGQQDHSLTDAWISADGGHLIICGKYASLIYSDNAGMSFNTAHINDTVLRTERDHIYRLFLSADGTHGVASCEGGHILTTTNSGRSWANKTLDFNKNKNLVGIWMDANQRNGWAVTANGLIYQKTEGKDNWIPRFQYPQTRLNVSSVWFTNDSTGWICGAGGLLLVTHDAGKSWLIKTLPDQQEKRITEGGGLTQLYEDIVGMDHSNNGQLFVLATRQGSIYSSFDKGGTWKRIRTGEYLKDTLTCVRYCPQQRQFYVGGNSGRIFITTDTMIDSISPLRPDVTINRFAADGDSLLAVGTHGLVVTGRAKQWREHPIVTLNADLYDAYVTDQHTWITGSEGRLFDWNSRVDNSLLTPVLIPDAAQSLLVHISFTRDGQVGFILSQSYRHEKHLYSNNQGKGWVPVLNLPDNDGLTDIRFGVNDSDIVITSVGGDIYRSVDRGLAWMPVQPRPVYGALNVIDIDPQNNLLFAGDGGTFIKAILQSVPIDTAERAFGIHDPLLGDSLSAYLNGADLPFKLESPRLLIGRTDLDNPDSLVPITPPGGIEHPWPRWINKSFPQNRELSFRLVAGNGWQMYRKTEKIKLGVPLWTHVQRVLLWDQLPDKILAVISWNAAILLFLYGIVVALILFFWKKKFIHWGERAQVLYFIVPAAWQNWLSLLIMRKRMQAAFVESFHAAKWQEFRDIRKNQGIYDWTWQPLTIDEEPVKPEEFYGKIESKIRKKYQEDSPCHIHISGAAGVGKSSLAFFLAHTFFDTTRTIGDPAYQVSCPPLFKTQPVLPIYLSQLNQQLDQELTEKIRYFYRYANASQVMLPLLMRNRRILTLIDGIPETGTFQSAFLDPAKGGNNSFLLITTCRTSIGDFPQIRIHLQGEAYPDSSLVQHPQELSLLLDKLLPGEKLFIPGSLRFYAASSLMRDTNPAAMQRTQVECIIYIWQKYLEATFNKYPKPGDLVRQLRILAYYCQGLHKIGTGATMLIGSQTIPLNLIIPDLIPELSLNPFIDSGIILQSGNTDDPNLSFRFVTLSHVLAAKELVIRHRDGLMDTANYEFAKKAIAEMTSHSILKELITTMEESMHQDKEFGPA